MIVRLCKEESFVELEAPISEYKRKGRVTLKGQQVNEIFQWPTCAESGSTNRLLTSSLVFTATLAAEMGYTPFRPLKKRKG